MTDTPTVPTPTDTTPIRPTRHIDVSGVNIGHQVDETWAELLGYTYERLPEPPIMLRGSTLVQIAEDDGNYKLMPYDPLTLALEASRAITFYKVTQNGPTPVKPPRDIIATLLRLPAQNYTGALRVDRVTDVPVVGADGSLTTTPGYQGGARVWYAPTQEFVLPEIGEHWDPEALLNADSLQQLDVDGAVAQLHEVLCDFPFADEASYAHAVALICEPFARSLIGANPTPLYGWIGLQPDSGKTIGADTCVGIGCGSVPHTTYTRDEDEFRKRITATLLAGRPVVFLDNVPTETPLDSSTLAAVLTSSSWEDRILGHTQMATAAIRNVWVFTANSPSISPEISRRIVPIRLSNPRPEGYQFKHALPQWATEHRAELVAAALTLVLNYVHGYLPERSEEGHVVATRMTRRGRMLNSYARWSEVMGGILAGAGITGFLGNLDEHHADVNYEREEIVTFLAAMAERLTEPATMSEWIQLMGGGTMPDGRIMTPLSNSERPTDLMGHGDQLEKALTYWFRGHRNAIHGGYQLVKHERSTTGAQLRPPRWSVERVL